MTILDGSPPAPLWDWAFQYLDELGFRFDPDNSAWRGNHNGQVFYVFAAEPLVARFPDRTMDLCAILGECDGVSADTIRSRIRKVYEEARGKILQGGSFTQDGKRYSRIAAAMRRKFGVEGD